MSDEDKYQGGSPSYDERSIDEAALDWLIKQDIGLTPEEQDAFFEWLAEDPRHGEWLAKHQKTYKQFDSLVQWRPEHSEEPNPDLLATSWVKRPWFKTFGTVAAAAVLLLGVSLWRQDSSDLDFQGFLPEQGMMAREYQIHRLKDGSIVELNTGAQIKMQYDADLRRVDLMSGEAYFEVAKDSERPFVVNARGIEVRAVGTAFNVKLAEDSLEVLVTHGKVLMDSSTLFATSDLADKPEPIILNPELEAGQRSLVSFVTEVVVPQLNEITEDEVEVELAWKHQVLEFIEKPLSEIVAEFNHYNTRQISIADQAIMDLEITATFRSYNLDGFVRLLELTNPIQAKVASDESITLVRDSDSP